MMCAIPSFSRRFLLSALLLSSTLALSACGDGWEMERRSGTVPYTQERTAGTGVFYVRAKMMPEKGLNLAEPKAEAPKEDVAATPVEPVEANKSAVEDTKAVLQMKDDDGRNAAETVFEEKQKK